MRKIIFLAALSMLVALPAKADVPGLTSHLQGGVLPNSPDYEWWYGCSPTSAGMIMGYYDRNGYGGYSYDNLVPGGVAELSNYSNPVAIVNQAIASTGHQYDFYNASAYGDNTGGGPGSGYGESGDDLSAPWHTFDSLADFMGTSQDAVGSSNGSTWFYFYANGKRLYASEMSGTGDEDKSGMYGLWEYEQYAGYGDGPVADQMIYNQYIYGHNSNTVGFTWADYTAEIDAGRPVMIHVEGHSMFGYGYDADTDEIILHDTWSEGEHRMAWGGSYPYSPTSSLQHYGVTVFEPTIIPVPGAVLLGAMGLGMVGWMKRRKQKA